MTAHELIAELRKREPHLSAVTLNIFFDVLAQNLYDCVLFDGRPLSHCDITGHREFWEEVREATRKVPLRPQLTLRQEQTRYRVSPLECGVCGHVHQNVSECGQWIGQGKHCRCTLEVTA
jgi:hypothetical protein